MPGCTVRSTSRRTACSPYRTPSPRTSMAGPVGAAVGFIRCPASRSRHDLCMAHTQLCTLYTRLGLAVNDRRRGARRPCRIPVIRRSDHAEAVEQLPRALQTLWGLGARPRPGPKPGLTPRTDPGARHRDRRRRGPRSAVDEQAGQGPRLHHDVALPLREQQGRAAHPARGHRDRAGPGDRARGGRLARTGSRPGWTPRWRGLAVHPWIVQLPITGAPNTPHTLAWVDQGLAEPGRDRAERDREGRGGRAGRQLRPAREPAARGHHAGRSRPPIARGEPRTPDDVLLGSARRPAALPGAGRHDRRRRLVGRRDPDLDFDFGVRPHPGRRRGPRRHPIADGRRMSERAT